MNIVCIGSGNVATHLSIALKAMGAEIIQVWSQNPRNAEILAALTQATAIHNWKDLDTEADCYIIAVKDAAIPEVAAQLKGLKGIVLHTSGATPIQVLAGLGSGYGVLYPLQTFSKSKSINLTKVPFCIEGDRPVTLDKIAAIAHLLSASVSEVSSAQRKILHLAAVFACNFCNQLYHLSGELLAQHELDFSLLRPLIMETAEKIQYALPKDVQTGPAVRADQETISQHLNLLKSSSSLTQIYQVLTESIKQTHQ